VSIGNRSSYVFYECTDVVRPWRMRPSAGQERRIFYKGEDYGWMRRRSEPIEAQATNSEHGSRFLKKVRVVRGAGGLTG
jgi:hypothetical protein